MPYTESGMTGSIFQTVMMDEAIGYSRRITRGIDLCHSAQLDQPFDNRRANAGHFSDLFQRERQAGIVAQHLQHLGRARAGDPDLLHIASLVSPQAAATPSR